MQVYLYNESGIIKIIALAPRGQFFQLSAQTFDARVTVSVFPENFARAIVALNIVLSQVPIRWFLSGFTAVNSCYKDTNSALQIIKILCFRALFTAHGNEKYRFTVFIRADSSPDLLLGKPLMGTRR